jgi:hypothetical protein
MDKIDTNKLIEDLKLTKQEERLLRYLAGLGRPEPKGRLDRFLHGPLGPGGVLLALLLIISVLALLFYPAWRWHFVNDLFKALGLPLLVFSLLFTQRRSHRLIKKLYLALRECESSGAVSACSCAPGVKTSLS